MKFDFVHQPGKENTLIVSFTGRGGEGMFGHELTPEFKKSLVPLDCHIGFAIDRTITWYNDIEVFEGIRDSILELQAQLQPQRTILLGMSMGGFGAILYSTQVPCDTVIALSPQMEIAWDLVKDWDQRYKGCIRHLDHFINPHVKDCFVDDVTYHVVYGDRNEIDQLHLAKVPDQPNIHKHILPRAPHNVAVYWKKRGILTRELEKLIKRNKETT